MHPLRFLRPSHLTSQPWLTALALALIFASPSAFAAGGKPPEEPEEAQSVPAPANEKAPSNDDGDNSDCRRGFCPGDAAIIYESGWTSQKVVVQSLKPNPQVGDIAVVKNPTSGDVYQIPLSGLALSWPNRTNIRCDKLGVCIGDKGWSIDFGVYRSVGTASPITVSGLRINVPDAEKEGAYVVDHHIGQEENSPERQPFFLSAQGRDIAVPRLNGKASCFNGVCTGDRVSASVAGTYVESEVLGVAVLPRFTGYPNAIVVKSEGKFTNTETYRLVMKRKKSADEIAREAEEKDLEEARRGKGFDMSAYQEARRQGLSHRAAMDYARGVAFTGFTTVSSFLSQLAQHVYAFDRAYLEELAQVVRSVESSRGPTDLKIYAGVMILPYLRHINYPGLRDRFLNPAVKAMEESLSAQGVRTLRDLDSGRSSRALALRFLAASLRTSKSVANDSQKTETDRILTVLGNALAASGSAINEQESQRIEAHIRDLAQNPYLTARAATDMALLEFLRSL